jgi:hypothetical protein
VNRTRLRRGTAAVLAAAVLGLGAAACGSSDEPPATEAATTATGAASTSTVAALTPEQTVTAYLDAFLEGDGEAACAILTPESQSALVAAFEEQSGSTAPGCPEIFELALTQTTEEQRERLRAATVGTATVREDTATVSLSAEGRDTPITLRRVEGEWRLANLPGQ